MKESIIVIGNRYASSIKNEIELMPARIEEDIATGNFGGFMFHNLATKCEMLNEYYGEQLKSIGFNQLLITIHLIGVRARELQNTINHPWLSLMIKTDNIARNNFVDMCESFNKFCQKVLPILFFI